MGNKLAAHIYLDLICAKDYPEQEPKHLNAKWYHLFWLLLPIVGVLMFILSVDE